MTPQEKRVRCRLLKKMTYDKIRPAIDNGRMSQNNVDWVVRQVMGQARDILDYEACSEVADELFCEF